MKRILAVVTILVAALSAWYFFNIPTEYDLDKVEITLDDDSYEKLDNFRLEALDKGYLERSEDDYVPAQVSYNGVNSAGKVRLKGDWTDHLNDEKWSFRIKLDNPLDDGLQVFSIQNPQARGFLNSYVFHKLLKEESVLSNEFRIVEAVVNGESWGVYCLEEHLTDRLYTSQGRNKGVIYKFNDQEFFYKSIDEEPIEGLIKSAKIKAYGSFKKNDSYKGLVKEGKSILKKYQKQKGNPYSKFNPELTGKYYAVCDLATAYHAMGWINIRFFYDFGTELMEPIGYDGYPELTWGKPYLGKHAPHYEADPFETQMVIYSALKDSAINQNYFDALERISSEDYVQSFMDKYEPEIRLLEKEIQKEYSDYNFDYDMLFSRATEIRDALMER